MGAWSRSEQSSVGVLSSQLPSPVPPEPSRKALWGLDDRLSTADITRSVSSWEEVRQDRTRSSRALRPRPAPAPVPAPAPGAPQSPRDSPISRNPRTRYFRRSSPCCSRPLAGSRAATAREAAGRWGAVSTRPSAQAGEPCADPRLGRPVPRSTPPTRGPTPSFLRPAFFLALADATPQTPPPGTCSALPPPCWRLPRPRC